MSKKILIILGHPARERKSFCEALAEAYKKGAEMAGHDVDLIKIADLSFDPVLHEGYKTQQQPEDDIAMAQQKLKRAGHWVIVYPLWQFMIPALLKGFFERTLTKGFAYDYAEGQAKPKLSRPLKGKTVRFIQTMGMPAFFYRLICKEHGAKALKSMMRFIGGKPVRITYYGLIETKGEKRRKRYLEKAEKLGESGR